MRYRPEIDGLRAVAIASVIAAHADFTPAGGGFVGVDVFFVISGYLITRRIRDDLAAGTFSYRAFLERRARRILPALLLVIVAASPFAWAWMLPDYLKSYGQSVVATLLFSNNLLLARTIGYWELESSFKPLLHTWSLGVEEQFYVAFPLLMLALRNRPRRTLLIALGGLSAISLCVAQAGSSWWPSVNFYLPFGRAWELCAGCLCALMRVTPAPRFGPGLAGVGLAGIVASVFLLTPDHPSPSLYVLPAVIGAALVILFAEPTNRTGALLGAAPFVGLGVVSYSAYLWHQPLFALARVHEISPPGPVLRAMMVVALVPLSYLSFRFVEQPFRKGATISTRAFAGAAGCLTAILIAGGLLTHLRHGFPERLNPGSRPFQMTIDYNERIRRFEVADFPADGRPNVLVIGNSFARDVANAMMEGRFFESRNLLYRQDRPSDCRRPPEGYAGSFERQFKRADMIVVAGPAPDCAGHLVAAAKALGKPALVVGPKDFGYNLNPFLRMSDGERAQARTRPRPEAVAMNDRYRAVVPDVDYLDLLATLGDGDTMPVFDADGNILSQDRMHFTQAGARFAEPVVMTALRRAGMVDGVAAGR